MPELPEIETIKRVTGQIFAETRRRGKFLSLCLESGDRITLHLRMTGCLLDQSVVAGIGNIYSDEILFAARIHPQRPANTLTKEEWNCLALVIPERLALPGLRGAPLPKCDRREKQRVLPGISKMTG